MYWSYNSRYAAFCQGLARPCLGQTHLNLHLDEAGQNRAQVILIPSSQETFSLDAPFAGFLLFEQVQGNMAQDGKVFCSMILPYTAMIFVKGDIQGPMQLIFDPPMRTHGPQDTLGASNAGDRVTVFATVLFTEEAFYAALVKDRARQRRQGGRSRDAGPEPFESPEG